MHAVLIGFGKMGQAMCKAWQEQSIFSQVSLIDPSFSNNQMVDAAQTYAGIDALPSDFSADLVIFAVKPQIMEKVVQKWQRVYQGTPPLYLSIAAGKDIAFFERILGQDQKIIRVMPNTPAAIGQGVSALCANQHVSDAEKTQITPIMAAVGQAHWLDDETLMDAVTAVSGSGPAYLFLLIEEMAKAGIAAGLDAELSMALARQTVIGSAALAAVEAETSAQTLRENVTSPGGTTAAALSVLMEGNAWPKNVTEAIIAARDRSRELA